MSKRPPKIIFFKDYERLCILSFAVLGNYLALIGLYYTKKAREHLSKDDLIGALRAARRARALGIYGLIPSTLLNVVLIYFICLFAWKIYSQELAPVLRGLF